MRPSSLVITLGIAALFVTRSAEAQAQPVPLGLRVFADINFRGTTATFIRDTPDLQASGMAKTVSSLQVAAGEAWQVCTEANFRGRCDTVTEDVSDLRRGLWNDAIASVRRLRAGRGSGSGFGPGFGRGVPAETGLRLFADINFDGASATLIESTPNLDAQHMRGAVSSVRVDTGEVWQVCTEADYRGRCQTITGDVSDLRRGNWNDVIVSARRIRGPSIGVSGNDRFATGLQAFADINYRGRSATFTANTPDVASRNMGATISSLRVAPGETWQVCTEPNYRGRCETITEDTSDLRRGDWNDVIASVRRLR